MKAQQWRLTAATVAIAVGLLGIARTGLPLEARPLLKSAVVGGV